MFIAWEQRFLFLDNLEAIAWQRGPSDKPRVVPSWDHVFSSNLDPVE